MDMVIKNCGKCGGIPSVKSENGRELIRCLKCGNAVDICSMEECELIEEYGKQRTVLPNKAMREALEEWNKGVITIGR